MHVHTHRYTHTYPLARSLARSYDNVAPLLLNFNLTLFTSDNQVFGPKSLFCYLHKILLDIFFSWNEKENICDKKTHLFKTFYSLIQSSKKMVQNVIIDSYYEFQSENMTIEDVTSFITEPPNSTRTWNSSALERLLEINMGPRQISSPWSLTTLYAIIFLLGLFGNLCTCIVIIRYRHMHSTTNFYLFSLAVSDILILVVGLPSEIYGIWSAYPWPFGLIYCFFKSMMSEVTSYASVLTITAFTVERYMAICHPLWAYTVSTLSRTLKVILGIWITSILIALPYPLYTRLSYLVSNPETGEPLTDSLQCTIPKEFLDGMTIMFKISTFLFFVTPLFVLIILYTLIVITVNRATVQRPSHNQRRLTSISTISSSGRSNLANSRRSKAISNTRGSVLKLLGILYFSHSAINPILYNIMSEKYKSAFLQTFCCRRCKDVQHRVNSVVTQHTG
ncbi:neuromedin-U receptor 2-like isoform X2 [Octopus sinensis]|uniref:Neuromedin-U receptor 2-like isoform X2 n=1 Tax=Octopus sinensis TaxID=2607531 RepID=A0A6P7UAE7_9MOLL|nr:neuromedin-U receptor 2-like isoform X2 [Octopus sinensis]